MKSAFLNGALNEEVYVDQPQGFIVKGKEGKMYKLKKALYGHLGHGIVRLILTLMIKAFKEAKVSQPCTSRAKVTPVFLLFLFMLMT